VERARHVVDERRMAIRNKCLLLLMLFVWATHTRTQQHHYHHHPSPSVQEWNYPITDRFKCNINVTFLVSSNMVGIGIHILD